MLQFSTSTQLVITIGAGSIGTIYNKYAKMVLKLIYPSIRKNKSFFIIADEFFNYI